MQSPLTVRGFWILEPDRGSSEALALLVDWTARLVQMTCQPASAVNSSVDCHLDDGLQDNDLVMRRFEGSATLQRIATKSQKGGTQSRSTDTTTDSETPKHTEIH